MRTCSPEMRGAGMQLLLDLKVLGTSIRVLKTGELSWSVYCNLWLA